MINIIQDGINPYDLILFNYNDEVYTKIDGRVVRVSKALLLNMQHNTHVIAQLASINEYSYYLIISNR